MNALFQIEPIPFNLPDADIIYYPQFFEKKEADAYLEQLTQEIPWQQDTIRVYGKSYPQPRLTSLFGNKGKSYSYSNIIMHPHEWNIQLNEIKSKIEKRIGTNFTSVLLNLYRDGNDSNGWHADNEKELGRNPIIASVSFGAERVFHLKHNSIVGLQQKICLEHGSLLLMQGSTQHFWKHQIAKTSKNIGPRINLTFRVINQ
jgi:alkylated DNA repair dioxygenase AlkB